MREVVCGYLRIVAGVKKIHFGIMKYCDNIDDMRFLKGDFDE